MLMKHTLTSKDSFALLDGGSLRWKYANLEVSVEELPMNKQTLETADSSLTPSTLHTLEISTLMRDQVTI